MQKGTANCVYVRACESECVRVCFFAPFRLHECHPRLNLIYLFCVFFSSVCIVLLLWGVNSILHDFVLASQFTWAARMLTIIFAHALRLQCTKKTWSNVRLLLFINWSTTLCHYSVYIAHYHYESVARTLCIRGSLIRSIQWTVLCPNSPAGH